MPSYQFSAPPLQSLFLIFHYPINIVCGISFDGFFDSGPTFLKKCGRVCGSDFAERLTSAVVVSIWRSGRGRIVRPPALPLRRAAPAPHAGVRVESHLPKEFLGLVEHRGACQGIDPAPVCPHRDRLGDCFCVLTTAWPQHLPRSSSFSGRKNPRRHASRPLPRSPSPRRFPPRMR